MFRLSVLLSAVMLVTLIVSGQDRGQMRPGLQRALAEGQEIVVLQRSYSAPVDMTRQGVPLAELGTESLPPPLQPVAPEAVPVAASAPAPQAAGVFTLAALPSIGGDRVRLDRLTADAVTPLGGALDTMPADEGRIRYISARSVNVRERPSTDSIVLDRLSSGEAVTVIAELDDGWSEVLIEGDGIYGFVSQRYLASSAP